MNTDPTSATILLSRSESAGRAGLEDLLRSVHGAWNELREALRGRLASVDPTGSATELAGALELAFDERLVDELTRAQGGDSRLFEDRFGAIGDRLASGEIPIRFVHEAASAVRDELSARLVRAHAGDAERTVRALAALHEIVDSAVSIVTARYLAFKTRLIEEHRTRTEQALLRFSRLFESGVLGIIVCDVAGNIHEANDGFLKMVGHCREDLLSGKVRWADMTPAEWKHLDDDAVSQLRERGVTRPWEKEYFRKDGSRVPVLVGVAMLDASDGVAFVVDITERKRFEALRTKSLELEAQNQRILAASRLKSEFLANMSHELRTPLNSIIGFAELLYKGEVPVDAPEHHEFLGDILSSGKHLLQLINDVLDLAKVEAGKMDISPERVVIAQLTAEVLAVLRGLAVAKSLRVELELDPNVQEVIVDPARLKQVLYNYLSNAVKFTPAGGRVVLRVQAEGDDRFRVEVEDTGIGITPKDLERLFVEFQQLDGGVVKRHGGTGLGLALTKRIVERQGGSVGVRSVLGSGSVFSAVLPRLVEPVGLDQPE